MIIWIVVWISIFFTTALGMTRPAGVLYGSQIGMSAFDIGMLVTAFSVVPMLIAIQVGKAADRFGDRLPIVIGCCGTALGLLLPCLFRNQASLYASQILVGISQLGVATSLQNLVGNLSMAGNRDRNFALFATAVSAGNFVGPFVGGLIAEHFSFLDVFAGGVVIALVCAGLGLLLPRHIAHKSVPKLSMGASVQLLRLPSIQRALVTGALIQYSRDIFTAYFPLFGEQIGLSAFEIGLVLSIQGLSMLLARATLPLSLRLWKRETILEWSVYLSAIAFLLAPATPSIVIACLAGIIMGFGLGCGQPISMTETFNASPPGRSGEVLGLRMTALRIGQSVAPLFFGVVGSTLGIFSVFVVNAAFLFGGGLFLSRRRR